MSMTAREPRVVWSSVRNAGIVGAVLGGALAVRTWRRARRTIRLARDSGDQMEVIARMRAVIMQAG
jgi:hypothetical protein